MRTKKLSFFLISLLLAIPCTAATIIVNWDGSGDYLTIQEGIDAAGPNDTVIVEPGWYWGEGNRDLDFGGKAITVRSTDPNDPDIVYNTVIYGEDAARGFIFDSGEGPNSVVDGLSIVFGQADNGAAIYCNGSSPTISNCWIWENHASGNGGGIYLNNSNACISHCQIHDNAAGSGGGAIYCTQSNPIILCCDIWANEADFTGAIYCRKNSSNVQIDRCMIYYNSATVGFSGGVFCSYNSNATISNSIISHNSSAGEAGGPISWGSDGGGGVSCVEDSTATITNCTIVANSVELGVGGGVYSRGRGAGINISNSIIWGNEAPNGPQLAVGSFSGLSVSYSDIEGGQSEVSVFNRTSTLNWGLGNIDADPCFVDEDYYDYHLKSQADGYDVTSLCIDAGNPGCTLGNEPNDANNVRINMGAYGGTAEASKTPADWGILADLTNDRIVDFNDLAGFVDYWPDTGQCIPSDLNRNQSVDFYDFAEFAACWPTGIE